ncbi:MAG: hypothetical protein ACI8TP_001236 [Acidimicrobiales bacterium]|jgi:uncharacterized protein with NAD-binding domain and iron-sulfur cluster
MAGLTTAWRLSDPEVRDRVGDVTLYQRGFRLGGKGASSRGSNGRIEEHGLHIWLGYYDNAFRVMRECYAELDRNATAPDAPIKTWRDAFSPAPHIGLDDLHEGSWSTWTAAFSANDLLPGEPIGETPVVTAVDMLRRSLRLVADFYQSLEWRSAEGQTRGAEMLAATGIGAVAGIAQLIESELGRLVPSVPSVGPLVALVERIRSSVMPLMEHHPPARRLWQLLDLVTAQIRGLLRDDLLRKGFETVDHLDYRSWVQGHGASPQTVESALVRGLYNLAFSHRGGDPRRTEFPAGLGLFLSMKTFFDFKGSIFWKMQAGMGDVVMAPLYQALRARGVRFEFFHRVEQLRLDASRTQVASVELGRQLRMRQPAATYDPLCDVDGLPCFPDHVDLDQVEAGPDVHEHNLESFWCQWPDADTVRLERGRDYDELVLAIPVGMTQHLAGELVDADPRWRDMTTTMETIGTQAFQLWVTESEAALGWPETGTTVTNYVDSYDTWASMTYLLDAEGWDDSTGSPPPKTLAYFCSSMKVDAVDDRTDAEQPRRARQRARADAISYIKNDLAHYWPHAIDESGRFRWDLLAGAEMDDERAFDSQFLTANVDPSDRYVQAVPSASHVRLRPDQSGFNGLHLAGDWTDCGLNAGCIEAAVLSGICAANSVLGLPRAARITGGYLL